MVPIFAVMLLKVNKEIDSNYENIKDDFPFKFNIRGIGMENGWIMPEHHFLSMKPQAIKELRLGDRVSMFMTQSLNFCKKSINQCEKFSSKVCNFAQFVCNSSLTMPPLAYTYKFKLNP